MSFEVTAKEFNPYIYGLCPGKDCGIMALYANIKEDVFEEEFRLFRQSKNDKEEEPTMFKGMIEYLLNQYEDYDIFVLSTFCIPTKSHKIYFYDKLTGTRIPCFLSNPRINKEKIYPEGLFGKPGTFIELLKIKKNLSINEYPMPEEIKCLFVIDEEGIPKFDRRCVQEFKTLLDNNYQNDLITRSLLYLLFLLYGINKYSDEIDE